MRPRTRHRTGYIRLSETCVEERTNICCLRDQCAETCALRLFLFVFAGPVVAGAYASIAAMASVIFFSEGCGSLINSTHARTARRTEASRSSAAFISTTASTSSAESDSDMCTNCQIALGGSAASAQSDWWFVPRAAIPELQMRWNSAGVMSSVASRYVVLGDAVFRWLFLQQRV